jgi:hypothetical protein
MSDEVLERARRLAAAANEVAEQMAVQVAEFSGTVMARRDDDAVVQQQQQEVVDKHAELEKERNAKVCYVMLCRAVPCHATPYIHATSNILPHISPTALQGCSHLRVHSGDHIRRHPPMGPARMSHRHRWAVGAVSGQGEGHIFILAWAGLFVT